MASPSRRRAPAPPTRPLRAHESGARWIAGRRHRLRARDRVRWLRRPAALSGGLSTWSAESLRGSRAGGMVGCRVWVRGRRTTGAGACCTPVGLRVCAARRRAQKGRGMA